VSAPRWRSTLRAALEEARSLAPAAPAGFGAAMAQCAQSIDGYPKPAGWLVRKRIGPIGPLSKSASEAVHAMHVANHLDALTV
jgi:hypothetical protein